MAVEISDAHRKWRIRIFTATWLSYIGFYFCRKPFSAAKSAIGAENGWDAETLGNIWAAYLLAYAIGQFVASRMGTALGPRRNVLLGMGLSILCTLAMGVTVSVPIMAGLAAVNGLAQATGWSGNVGTMAGWFHKHERGRVMGLWSTNFTIGSLVSGWTMAWALSLENSIPETWSWMTDLAPAFRWESESWRYTFYVGAAVLAVMWVNFYVNQRNRPEDVGLAAIDDPVTPIDESKPGPHPEQPPDEGLGLSRAAWTNLLLVSGFYFFAKFIRYAVWSWSAYFLSQSYGLSSASANVYATVFDIMGILGVWATGYLSDKLFASRRSEISLIMMLGMTVATALLMAFGGTSVMVFAILLGCVGFTLYGPDALLTGAGAMDIGGRKAATFAAGVISGFGSLGPIVQELVIARMYDSKSGDMGPVFILLFGSAAMASVFCAILVVRNRRGGKGV